MAVLSQIHSRTILFPQTSNALFLPLSSTHTYCAGDCPVFVPLALLLLCKEQSCPFHVQIFSHFQRKKPKKDRKRSKTKPKLGKEIALILLYSQNAFRSAARRQSGPNVPRIRNDALDWTRTRFSPDNTNSWGRRDAQRQKEAPKPEAAETEAEATKAGTDSTPKR